MSTIGLFRPDEIRPYGEQFLLSPSGSVKLMLYLAHDEVDQEATPEEQARAIEIVSKGLALAERRGFHDGERLVRLLARGPDRRSTAIILSLFDQLFACVTAEEFLREIDFPIDAQAVGLEALQTTGRLQ